LARVEAHAAQFERHRQARLGTMAEIERQGVYRRLGYTSLLEMCVCLLGMDEVEVREDLERIASSAPLPRERDSGVRITRMKDPPRPERAPQSPVRKRPP
jgi:hypothetical protein